MNTWEEEVEHFDLSTLRCFEDLKDKTRLFRSLGTLGSGNHFIEIDRASDGAFYLVIHSGSRNLGKQVAELYQRIAVDLHMGRAELVRKRAEIIRAYKEQGRATEIEPTLRMLQDEFESQTLAEPEDLCWLYGSDLADYLHDVEVCQRFARRNREIMAKVLLDRAGLTAIDAFHTIHNYIDTDEMILRKGAIAAHRGVRVLIPINMRDGSVLAVGRGNPEWNDSAPHGAGRVMSRSKARECLDLDAYRQSMAGVYTTSVSAGTIDEAPMAYKSLSDIIDVIRDSVDVIDVIKPVYNFKATDEDPPWKKKPSAGK